MESALAMFSAGFGVQANWVAATVTFIAGSGGEGRKGRKRRKRRKVGNYGAQV
jgi:hypothetical protein